jgi:hypothetical protein
MVGVTKASLVLGEVVDVGRDHRAAAEAGATRVDEAWFGGRRAGLGGHDATKRLIRGGAKMQLERPTSG